MIKLGIIGYGYWGPGLVRNFSEAPGAEVAWVCDLDRARLNEVSARYPSIGLTTDVAEVLKSADVDAVAIATPVSTHFDLALEALRQGKHVLVEKPLADTSDRCKTLIEEASSRGLTLMVDHTFCYTGAVRKMKELADGGDLGELCYYDSVRVNLGLFQHDVNVVWDLAVHDLAILDLLTGGRVADSVSASGTSHVEGQPENIAYLTLYYDWNFMAHIHVNWLAPVKVRQTLLGGDKKMILYDDMEPSEKIKIYDKGVTLETNPEDVYEMRVGYRTGDMLAPKLEGTEALQSMARHFLQCIADGSTPITSAESGLRVVQTIEAAVKSIAGRGKPIDISAARD